MSNKHKFFALCVVVVVVFVGTTFLLQRQDCYSQWSSSGMRVEWGPFRECQLEISPGRWIPAKAYRQLP